MSTIKVRWQASDGYAGGARPQTFTLDLDEMAENCETEDEALYYLEREVQDDFENKVSASITNQDEVLAAWRARTAGEKP